MLTLGYLCFSQFGKNADTMMSTFSKNWFPSFVSSPRPPVSRCLVLSFHHHALILATSSHNAILPYLSFKLVTSTYNIAFYPIYPFTLPLPWSNRVQLGSDRWLNQPQQALSLPSVIRSLCRRLFVERPQNATFVPFQPLDNSRHQRPALKTEQKAAWSIFPKGRTLTI